MRLDDELHDPPEREISLGTATILGIFLALALVCAAFFGFGYSLGRHSNSATVPAASEAKVDKTDSPFSGFKSQTAPAHSADDSDTPPPTPASDEKIVAPQDSAKTTAPARNVALPIPPPQPVAPPTTKPSPPATTTEQFIVQVSATSRQGDAESLIAALKTKGYAAAIRQQPQDKLFHVQIGPFPTKKDADAMRQRLDTDGYKAIVK